MEAVARTGAVSPAQGRTWVERRSHPRFKIREDAVAFLGPTLIGQVSNISEKGLAMQYPAARKRWIEPQQRAHSTRAGENLQSPRLTISLADGILAVGMIPYKVIWDGKVPQAPSSGGGSLRQCGVEFGDLERCRRAAVRFFLDYYTIPDR